MTDNEEHEFLGVEWEVEVRDKDGNVTDHKKGKNSLLVGMAAMLFQGFEYYGAYYECKDTGGNTRTPGWNYTANWCGPYVVGAATIQYYGIVIGTDATAVTADDYKLGSQVAHGIAGGQMQYMGTVLNAVVNASPRSSVRIDRMFTNGSGGSITIKELGIYMRGTYYICVCRDVIPDTPVADGSSIFVKYTIYITI